MFTVFLMKQFSKCTKNIQNQKTYQSAYASMVLHNVCTNQDPSSSWRYATNPGMVDLQMQKSPYNGSVVVVTVALPLLPADDERGPSCVNFCVCMAVCNSLPWHACSSNSFGLPTNNGEAIALTIDAISTGTVSLPYT